MLLQKKAKIWLPFVPFIPIFYLLTVGYCCLRLGINEPLGIFFQTAIGKIVGFVLFFPFWYIGIFWLVSGVTRKTILVALGGLVFVLSLNVILFSVGALHHTKFSPNFSEERYAQIQAGMDSIEVKRILGEPLREFTRETDSLVYLYAFDDMDNDAVPMVLFAVGINGFHEYGNRRVVLANSSGKVLYKDPTD